MLAIYQCIRPCAHVPATDTAVNTCVAGAKAHVPGVHGASVFRTVSPSPGRVAGPPGLCTLCSYVDFGRGLSRPG